MSSNITIGPPIDNSPKLRTLVITTQNEAYNTLAPGDFVPFSIVFNDYTGITNLTLTKELVIGAVEGQKLIIDQQEITNFSGHIYNGDPGVNVFSNGIGGDPGALNLYWVQSSDTLSIAVNMQRSVMSYYIINFIA